MISRVHLLNTPKLGCTMLASKHVCSTKRKRELQLRIHNPSSSRSS
jgi:hypothetical protein